MDRIALEDYMEGVLLDVYLQEGYEGTVTFYQRLMHVSYPEAKNVVLKLLEDDGIEVTDIY